MQRLHALLAARTAQVGECEAQQAQDATQSADAPRHASDGEAAAAEDVADALVDAPSVSAPIVVPAPPAPEEILADGVDQNVQVDVARESKAAEALVIAEAAGGTEGGGRVGKQSRKEADAARSVTQHGHDRHPEGEGENGGARVAEQDVAPEGVTDGGTYDNGTHDSATHAIGPGASGSASASASATSKSATSARAARKGRGAEKAGQGQPLLVADDADDGSVRAESVLEAGVGGVQSNGPKPDIGEAALAH